MLNPHANALLRISRRTVGGALCLLAVAGYFLFWKPNVLVHQPDRLCCIPRGTSLEQVVERLQSTGCIDNTRTFAWVARLLRYRPEEKPGCYRLRRNSGNWATLRLLRSGMQTPVKIRFGSAKDKKELAARITKNTGIAKEAFAALLDDPAETASYGFTPENVLVLFIPDTYEVYWTLSAKQLLAKMHVAYRRFWNAKRLKQAADMGLTPIEVSILASMVQEETNHLPEAAAIAGVFVNRLQRKVRLESCPTLLYALRGKSSEKRNRLLWKELYVDSPYNLYRRRGLPPGPIALPQVATIEAVLNYTRHDYLFFSAKEDGSGTHYFARTHAEHLRNARKYRAALTRRKILH